MVISRPIRLLLALLVTALAVWAVRALPVERMAASLAAAQLPWIGAAVLAHLVIQPVAATQWGLLLGTTTPPLAWRTLLRVFSLTSVANNTANSLVGHAAGTTMLARLPGVGATRALSLLVLDQLCVGVAKITVLLVAMASLGAVSSGALPSWLRTGLLALVIPVVLLLFATIVAPRGLAPWLSRLPVVGARVHTWLEIVAAVPPRRVLAAVGCALLVKGCEAGGIAAVQLAFDVPVTVHTVALALAATAVATLIPVMPANLGSYEGSVYVALTLAGISPTLALTVALAQHATQLLAAILPGVLVAWQRSLVSESPPHRE